MEEAALLTAAEREFRSHGWLPAQDNASPLAFPGRFFLPADSDDLVVAGHVEVFEEDGRRRSSTRAEGALGVTSIAVEVLLAALDAPRRNGSVWGEDVVLPGRRDADVRVRSAKGADL